MEINFVKTQNTENNPLWLSHSEKVKLGAFYTPSSIVSKALELVRDFKDKAVLLDPAGGCGAFIEQFEDWDYRIADIDLSSTQAKQPQGLISQKIEPLHNPKLLPSQAFSL
ncbi:MAG: N-6 DNA methylase [Archaeoglobaceae archaeon]